MLFPDLTAIALLAMLGEVLIKGWRQLGWSFFTEATPNAYKAMMATAAGEAIPGGIANGIVRYIPDVVYGGCSSYTGRYFLWNLLVGISQKLVCSNSELS